MSFKQFWTDAFCEKGVASSKRIIGAIMMIAAVAYTGYLTFQYGAIEIVKDLITTLIMMGSLLLGLSNVTDIWKKTVPPPVQPEEDIK